MDRTETYIKMRIKAIPDLGRGELLEDTHRSENFYVEENDIYSVFIARNGNWHIFHPDIRNYLKVIDSQGRTCQLERQDQLQEMVSSVVGDTTIDAFMLHSFLPFCHAEMTLWGSMEQLWLAFVMKELHSKIWDGDNWIKAGSTQA